MYNLMLNRGLISLFLQVLPISLLAGSLYGLWKYRKSGKIPVIRVLFVCYLTGLFNLILVPQNLWSCFWAWLLNGDAGGSPGALFSGGFNFVPTLFLCLTGQYALGSWVRTMLVGNVAMFLPMGFFFPWVTDRITVRNILPVSLLIPLAMELVQPIVGRSFVVDDLLTNALGILLGFFLAAAGKALLKK